MQYYGRYVDDIVVYGYSGQELNIICQEINSYANEKLEIKLHPRKTSINKIECGVNFVGYIIKPYRRYLRNSIISNLMQKAENPLFFKNADVIASVNSYLGMLRHVNGYKARRKICQRLEWLGYPSDLQMTKLLTQ